MALAPSASPIIFTAGTESSLLIYGNSQKHTPTRHNGTIKFLPSVAPKLSLVKAKASKKDKNTKQKSVICTECDGNGAVLCSQCQGSGVNSTDVFNGQFKSGDSCWLCGGKKEMLCGNCNGAGFLGGFMNTFDE